MKISCFTKVYAFLQFVISIHYFASCDWFIIDVFCFKQNTWIMSYIYTAVVIIVILTRAIRMAISEIVTMQTVSWTTMMINFIVLHKIGQFECDHNLILIPNFKISENIRKVSYNIIWLIKEIMLANLRFRHWRFKLICPIKHHVYLCLHFPKRVWAIKQHVKFVW